MKPRTKAVPLAISPTTTIAIRWVVVTGWRTAIATVVTKLATALSGITQNAQATSLISLPVRAASRRLNPTQGATKAAGCRKPARTQTLRHHVGPLGRLVRRFAIVDGLRIGPDRESQRSLRCR